MELTAIVTGLALIEYAVLTLLCGRERARRGVLAPATSGDPSFERYFRVQQNSVEQLIIFVPAMFLFGRYVSEPIGAGLGLVFILGRALYARGYCEDPPKRAAGFGLSLLSNLALLIGGLIGAVVAYL
ncbi:MAG: MAPEG family protein [Deltaproteobacteria bacterium]|nr:MAPEG family protein [Deltaproteobacteria bacterium]